MNHCFPERTGTPMAIDTVFTKKHTHTNPNSTIDMTLSPASNIRTESLPLSMSNLELKTKS